MFDIKEDENSRRLIEQLWERIKPDTEETIQEHEEMDRLEYENEKKLYESSNESLDIDLDI